ncbi:MAG: chorismate mutase [Robiginitomaculum sp.]|nr:chorismate mutase [Robiginitomaculum sp.]
MTKDTPPSRNKILPMETIRTEIDRVDNALLNLIAERMDLAQAVRLAKSGSDVWRPSREESLIRDLANKASTISPKLVSRIWAELTSASLSLQGPIHLHISLSGDALSARILVRDRFGAAIPIFTYPTESTALAKAYADPEGVAVLPAPGGMNNWWTALGPKGATPEMHILAALPRIGNWHWPEAVAVSKAQCLPSGSDQTLLYIEAGDIGAMRTMDTIFADLGLRAQMRAEVNDKVLYSVDEYLMPECQSLNRLKDAFSIVKIIGILPRPIENKE